MRLDHLLSKEHHERHPNKWGASREGFSSVVDEGRVQATSKSQTHYWVLRQHSDAVSRVVPPSWWWGVVFENWIVVASIKMYALPFAVTCCFVQFYSLVFVVFVSV